MKSKQQKNTSVRAGIVYCKPFLLWIIALFIYSVELPAQLISVEQRTKDITIPADGSVGQVYFVLQGGDGGNSSVSGHCVAKGGAGARVSAVFNVGNGSNKIPPGSTLRFIRGEKGSSQDAKEDLGAGQASGGGGGGSAVLFRSPNSSTWTILAVAGGGGGGYSNVFMFVCTDNNSGKGGNSSSNGSDGASFVSNTYYSISGGTNGGAGVGVSSSSGGGAGANGNAATYSAGKGYPSGGAGGSCSNCTNGGFGFGGGGAAEHTYSIGGGGGGGYSGGGGSSGYSGGGGGSYVNSINAGKIIIKGSDGGGNKSDGYVKYAFTGSEDLVSPVSSRAIQFAYNTGKCLDDYGSKTNNGNNIQTYTCTGNPNQAWYFSPWDRSIRLELNTDKCLDLDHSNTANSTNIQLWDCNGSDAQNWLYNGIHQTIHSGVNSDKCLNAANGSSNPNSNVNVQLWDCNYSNNNQKWTIAGATTVSYPGNVKHIVPPLATGYAVHSHTGAESGSNIQLWTKDDINTAEQWIFDGLAIKLRNHNLCIDLKSSNTSNGNNVQLYNCNGTNAQKWIYDGMTQTIRSVVNPNKCLQIEKNTDGAYAKRSNVQIWDCNGSATQQFLIEDMPCVDDITPPVAKCKDITLTGLTAPVASQLDNGSTDNCSISSKSLRNESGNTYRLTVTDEAGNSSSCTATVSYN